MKLVIQFLPGFTFAMLWPHTMLAAGPPVPFEWSKVGVLPNYYDKVKVLAADYICGYKVVSTTKTWESTKYKPDYFFTITKTCIHGTDKWLSTGFAKGPTGDTEQSGVFLTCDSAYRLGRSSSTDSYKLSNQSIDWINTKDYASRFQGFSAVSAQIHSFSHVKATDLLLVDDVSFEGIPAIRFELKRNGGATQSVYIDRETYQYLYSEIPHASDSDATQTTDRKQIGRTTYRLANGKRLPERYDLYYETPAGVKQPIQETVFAEYVPYTPTADELDLEKQFGVKPIPHPPRPDSAIVKPQPPRESKVAIWLYATGGAVLLVAVALGLFLYRRSRRAD